MTRILLLHGARARADAAPAAPDGVELAAVEAEGADVIRRLKDAGERADAVVVAPDGACAPDAALAEAMRGAGVPVVEVHARNIETEGGPCESAAGATAVVHGFGDRALGVAVAAARRLAGRGGEG